MCCWKKKPEDLMEKGETCERGKEEEKRRRGEEKGGEEGGCLREEGRENF